MVRNETMSATDNRKVKLFLSRDQHSELTRKLIGRSHSDRLFTSDSHRSSIYLPDLYQSIDSGIEEILKLELLQMSIPGMVALPMHSKHVSKTQELASLQAELSREEKERPARLSDVSDIAPTAREDSGLSLELNHNSSFSSSTPTDHWSPFTHYGSNDSCEREFFPSINTTRDMSSSSSSTISRSGTGRNPLVAKRNSNIDRMLNEVSQRPSRNQSPKMPVDVPPSSGRFSFMAPHGGLADRVLCLTPPGTSAIAKTADSEIAVVPPPVPPIGRTASEANGNRRLSNGEKAEKRFVTTFPVRPAAPKSPVTVPAVQAMPRQDRISYHQNLSRKLAQVAICFLYFYLLCD